MGISSSASANPANALTVIITGASRGIGKEIATLFAQANYRLLLTARDATRLQQTVQTLGADYPGATIHGQAADLSVPQEAINFGRLCLSHGKPSILINNAGTAWGDPYEKYPEEAFDKVFRTNVGAMFSLTRDLSPLLEKRACPSSPSRVVNIGSIDGLHIPTVHRTGTFAYTASKAAVHHLTRHLAQELGRKHITVNAIAPGFFPSKMTDSIFEQHGADLVANSLLGRVGQATDIAGTAIYLASAAGAYTHGVVLPVDGGTLINHQHARD